MVSKLISLKKEAYEKLVALKRPGQSFSDLILELTRPRGQLDEFIGMWSDAEAAKVEARIKELKRSFSAGIRRKNHVLFGH